MTARSGCSNPSASPAPSSSGTVRQYGSFDIALDQFSRISHRCAIPRAPCGILVLHTFTWCRCLLDADWCLQFDGVTDSHLQADAPYSLSVRFPGQGPLSAKHFRIVKLGDGCFQLALKVSKLCNFDTILDYISQLVCHLTCTVWHARLSALSARAYFMLIGVCHPMVWPIRACRSATGSRP